MSDISDDLQEQLAEHLTDKCFALQMDKANDSNRDCLFIAYVVLTCQGHCVKTCSFVNMYKQEQQLMSSSSCWIVT